MGPGGGKGRFRSALVQRELLDHRVSQQFPGQLGHAAQRGLVRGPAQLHLEPLALPDPEYLAEAEPVRRAGRSGLLPRTSARVHRA